jgi:hypothetical protein
MDNGKELDILEMPVEGLAAYWLSIKKLLDAKKDPGFLDQETENTTEPFIRHLLETALSAMDPELAGRLAGIKRATLLAEYRRKIDMIRMALVGIAAAENPRMTLIRLSALTGPIPFNEKRTFELAYGLMNTVSQKDADLPTLLCVDHKQKDDRLVVKLLFYAIMARRSGRQSLHEHIPHLKSGFFAEGLSLCADGFDADFLGTQLASIRDAALAATRRKMNMSTQMCLAIREGLVYDEVFKVARSFMV